MRFSVLVLVMILPVALLSACANQNPTTTNQNFTVITPGIDGAFCKLTDSQGFAWNVSATPGSAMILKGAGPLTVICSKQGYKTTVELVKERGIFPSYPPQVEVIMEPLTWKSEGEKEEWELQKISRKRAEEDKRHECYFSALHNC
jgi:hypothetical protein